MIITTIILFLLILGVIVFFHELGHFFMAKLYGVKVEEFAIGFPPKIFGIKKGETEYTLNWIPLGGFCRIVGEDGENKNDPRSFGSKSIFQRFQIISAGVIMNFVLAFVIYSFIFMAGSPMNIEGEDLSNAKSVDKVQVRITGVVENTPAFDVGLELGDVILKVDEEEIEEIEDLQNYTKENLGENIVLTISRGEETIEKEIVPRKEYSEDEGAMGVSLVKIAVVKFSPLEAIKRGFEWTVFLTFYILTAFATIIQSLVTTGQTVAEVSGPVGIAAMTSQAASLGIIAILNFTALISINLAIINALPFPALDGGRLVFLMVEKIKGSPIKQEWEAKVNNFGFMLLMLLMVVVTFKDLMKFDVWGRIMGLFG
ncbi:RIP metalloprotease RseP [Candidatus Parcubacteria bacterium]|nr:RIP metalloprotease RseP [Candidatus Parcubacteria bacterium]